MSKELDTMGRAARVHLHELQLCKDKTKNYANRRKEATELLRRMLTPIWAALEAGETVNGIRGKEAWAQWYNPSARGANGIRQIQRIINPKPKATSGRPSPMALLKELITFISEQPRNKKDPDTLIEIRGKATEIADDIDWLPPVWKKELDEERAAVKKEREVLFQYETEKRKPKLNAATRMHKAVGEEPGDVLCGKPTAKFVKSTELNADVNCTACVKLMKPQKVKAADPAKELNKRFRLAKRVAKFYGGMMKELTDGVNHKYEELRELYPHNSSYSDNMYPWTPPQPGYRLPPTIKKFEEEYDAAFAEFNKVVEEIKAFNEKAAPAEPLSEPAKALAAAETANKHTKGINATPADAAATTGLVKMARIDNKNEFGVFPESCWKYTRANALTIGTRQVCEAERDRINAKRLADNDSVENLVTHGDAHESQQQNPAAEALEKALDSMESVDVSDEDHAEEQCNYTEEQVAPMIAQGGE